MAGLGPRVAEDFGKEAIPEDSHRPARTNHDCAVGSFVLPTHRSPSGALDSLVSNRSISFSEHISTATLSGSADATTCAQVVAISQTRCPHAPRILYSGRR